MLKINGKEYPVKGRTYRKIAEQQSWWVSQCFCPVTELRSFLYSHSAFSEKDFVSRWLKASRTENVANQDLQNKIMSTFAARRFDIWQACRDGGLRIEEIDEHLDSLDNQQLSEFFEDADRKMAIANGVGEFDFLFNCYKATPVSTGKTKSVEAMIAQICVRNKNRMPLDEVLDSTPAMLAILFEDPDVYVQDPEANPNDTIGKKIAAKLYERMSLNLIENKRIDAIRPKEPKEKKEPDA